VTTLIHLHIPRTGGITVSRLLRTAYRGRVIVDYRDLEDFRKQTAMCSDIALVVGHSFWGLHEFLPGATYFVVLRDPVARVLSLYDFIRTQRAHRRYAEFNSRKLEEILSVPGIERKLLANGQVRQLIGPQAEGAAMGEAELERAWSNLCLSDVVIAFTDQLANGLAQLSERVGIPIGMPTKTRNASPRSNVSDEGRRRIELLNQWDRELYSRARERFAKDVPQGAELREPRADISGRK
jgi:hypothetical protein